MQIKSMPENERPQEKLLFAGPGALSNAELLALIIRTGTDKLSALQLAEEVISAVSEDAGGLASADVRELMIIRGIGAAKACSVAASVELSKRLLSGCVAERAAGPATARDVYELLCKDMMSEKRELFVSLHLNTKMQIESKHIVSIGCLDSAPVHPREVFRPAVKSGAAAVIVAHNHPSGDPEPSKEDKAVTERLLKASSVMGIKLLDHIIIGHGRYVSLRETGLIP